MKHFLAISLSVTILTSMMSVTVICFGRGKNYVNIQKKNYN